jgi:hypothetical protein
MKAHWGNLFLATTVLFLAGDAASLAQTNPGIQRVVGFTVFAAEAIEGWGYLTQPGEAPVPLRFFPTERSPRYEVRGRPSLRLVAIETGETVAEVAIPEGLREVLVLVTPATAGTDSRRHRLTVFDDSTRQRGPGQVQLLNLSGLELTAELNGRRVAAAAGLNPAQDAGRSARLLLRTEFRGRSYLSWHETITLGPGGRALVVLFPPFLGGSLEVQTRVLVDDPAGAGR